MTQTVRKTQVLLVGGGPGGRVSYMALRRMGVSSVTLVSNEEPTVICSLPYGVGRRLVPGGPEAVVVDLAKSPRMPSDMLKDILQGTVRSVDAPSRQAVVDTAEGTVTVAFDTLILAPGAAPWMPALPGILRESPRAPEGTEVVWGEKWIDKGELREHVHVLRGAGDARRLDALANRAKHVVVVGSGAIGLEVAEALVDRGVGVTLAEVLPHVVSALDEELALRVEARLRERGVGVRTGVRPAEVTPEGLLLQGGELLRGDGVVFATGVRPSVRLARELGARVEKGIVVDAQGRTSVPGVLAVGDAVQISDGATGLPLLPLIGTLAMRQALVAAATVVGMPWALPPATVWGLSEIFGLHWGSVGWSVEAATRAGLPVVALTQPVRTRDPFMPEGREGIWKLTVAAAEEKGLRRGQILGFQVVQEGDSPLFLAERFIDIITRRETVPELFGHYFIHSPAHNAVDDPYLNLIFQAQALMQ